MASNAVLERDSNNQDRQIIRNLRATLCSEGAPLAHRFRALFSLKHYGALDPQATDSLPAIQAIAAAFSTPSALLKHELAYCLGQTKHPAAIPFLRDRLTDENEVAICRHEAAEALGALGDVESLPLLRKYRDDPNEEVVVKETCEIAVARLEWQISQADNHESIQKR